MVYKPTVLVVISCGKVCNMNGNGMSDVICLIGNDYMNGNGMLIYCVKYISILNT